MLNILFIILFSSSLCAYGQDTTKWNFGVKVILGTSNTYPYEGDYRVNYPGVYPLAGRSTSPDNASQLEGYISYRKSKKFAYSIGFLTQYNFSKTSAIEMGVMFNNKNCRYPIYTTSGLVARDYWLYESYYLDIPISYQYSFILGEFSKLRISTGITGCIFLFGDQTKEFFLDMYGNAVVLHSDNYLPIAMMLDASLEYVFPLFKSHIAIGPTFQIAPMSFTKNENTITAGGQTFQISKEHEFKPYFIGAEITYYLK